MDLIHPILGTKRVWPDSAPLNGAPARAGGSPALNVLTRSSLADHSLGLIYTPVTPERARMVLSGALNGDLQAQYDLFCTMEDSWDRLAKALNEVKNGVKRLTWNVTAYAEGEDEPSPVAQAKADLVQRALKNWRPEIGSLEYSFEDAIYHALDAMGKGLSVQEIHWSADQAKRELLPRAAHYVTPRQYGWNAEGTLLGLTNNSRPSAWMEFPTDQFLVGQWHARTGLPGATALLRPLVPYWLGMTYGWRWLMQTAQIFGVPFRWATYATDEPQLKQQIAEMLENLGSSGWAAFPAGTTLEFKEAVSNARDNPQALIIEMAKKACDLLILGQELSGESQAAGLGSGNAALQGKVRQDVFHGAAAWTADLVNYQLIPSILRLNYGDEREAPTIAADLSIDPDPKLLAERDQILLQAADVQMPKKWFHERHGIPLPEEGDEVITGKAAPTPTGAPGAAPSQPGAEPADPAAAPGAEKPEDKPMDMKTQMAAKSFVQAALDAKANDAVADKLVDNVLEDLTGVQARWLGGVKPFFRDLVEAARNENLTDAQFIAVLEKAQKDLPELFAKLNTKALAASLEAAMGAAAVNGAVQGFMKRKFTPGYYHPLQT